MEVNLQNPSGHKIYMSTVCKEGTHFLWKRPIRKQSSDLRRTAFPDGFSMVGNWLFLKWTKTVTLSLKNKLPMRNMGQSSLRDSQKRSRWYHILAIYLGRQRKIEESLKEWNYIMLIPPLIISWPENISGLLRLTLLSAVYFPCNMPFRRVLESKRGQNWSG